MTQISNPLSILTELWHEEDLPMNLIVRKVTSMKKDTTTSNPMWNESNSFRGEGRLQEGIEVVNGHDTAGGGGQVDIDGTGDGEGGGLQRSLMFWDGFGVVVGIMIGSGIFSSPGAFFATL